MLGELQRSGVGEPMCLDRVKSVAALQASCEKSNAVLVNQLREDSNASELLRITREDAAMGRMTEPVPVSAIDTAQALLNPRFGVEKEKEDGEIKVRAVDHLSWSPGTQGDAEMPSRPCKRARKEASVNGHTVPAEKMRHDTLDSLAVAMRQYVEVVGVIPGLIKADIDAAFRRIPVAPEHRWACWVAFIVLGEVFVSQHGACPFGAVASVHAWERVGAAIAHLARKFLKIALLRYVDDMFAPERPATMAHALRCLARLIRAILGPTAVAAKKLACGKKLDVLGVDVKLSRRGFKCKPTKHKTRRWRRTMKEALADNRLPPGEASKLAGRLSWGASSLFRKLGRAMIRPIFDQKTRRDGKIAPELARALEWWIAVLEGGLCERRTWWSQQLPPVHLFCDASGSPAHLGAVLFVDDSCFVTHYVPPRQLMEKFRHRRDNQIMGLELLSISLGFCTFEHLIRGRNVIVHSDNTGSEATLVCVWYVSVLAMCFVCVSGGNPARYCHLDGSCAAGAHTVDPCSGAGIVSAHSPGWNARQYC